MNTARYAFTATVLQNGSVLVVGGAQLPNSESTWDNSQLLASCELYVNGTWYPSSNLTYPRAGHQVHVAFLPFVHLTRWESALNASASSGGPQHLLSSRSLQRFILSSLICF